MTHPLAEKIGINVQGGTVNVQNLNIGIAERLGQSGDRILISFDNSYTSNKSL